MNDARACRRHIEFGRYKLQVYCIGRTAGVGSLKMRVTSADLGGLESSKYY